MMDERTKAKLDNIVLAGRRRPVQVMAVYIIATCATLVATAHLLNGPDKDCLHYAARAKARRQLNHAEEREVARSCGVSRWIGPFGTRPEAEQAADHLNGPGRRLCADPGAYVALWFDDSKWAAVCPQL